MLPNLFIYPLPIISFTNKTILRGFPMPVILFPMAIPLFANKPRGEQSKQKTLPRLWLGWVKYQLWVFVIVVGVNRSVIGWGT